VWFGIRDRWGGWCGPPVPGEVHEAPRSRIMYDGFGRYPSFGVLVRVARTGSKGQPLSPRYYGPRVSHLRVVEEPKPEPWAEGSLH